MYSINTHIGNNGLCLVSCEVQQSGHKVTELLIQLYAII